MNQIFSRTKFIGDISKWDVSSVTDMVNRFADAALFNGNISRSRLCAASRSK